MIMECKGIWVNRVVKIIWLSMMGINLLIVFYDFLNRIYKL